MIDYVDPIPPVVQFLSARISKMKVYGNTFPQIPVLPVLLVRSAGGDSYTRLQLICRASKDYEAMQGLIQAMNILTRAAGQIQGLRVQWCEPESNPILTTDTDTGKPEAWCYMRLEHIEA
ncbi:hypothetical protein SAMN04489735_105613 [Aneurinibacillus thermoaerophilus]|uniref:DUF3168 domain-containing protein n=1 Tax=Aneurinibacillus thermoaerophilus TaxID=143495 RepID=A0A1G8F529_ANETH|nr:hypothetical protein [Aneurinibacillus thermoaerophilus]SDH77214.1 hypothetical protein SAMN04489735_105613 [Aneurinibacillus thermoaerophilus]